MALITGIDWGTNSSEVRKFIFVGMVLVQKVLQKQKQVRRLLRKNGIEKIMNSAYIDRSHFNIFSQTILEEGLIIL
jgi:hypothetical protein